MSQLLARVSVRSVWLLRLRRGSAAVCWAARGVCGGTVRLRPGCPCLCARSGSAGGTWMCRCLSTWQEPGVRMDCRIRGLWVWLCTLVCL